MKRHIGHLTVACALLAFFSATQALSRGREDQVEVRGCAQDIEGYPVRNSSVELHGLNYQGGADYADDGGNAQTDWEGKFTLFMKKGSIKRPAEAKITVWSTIAGSRSMEAGGIAQDKVSNTGGPIQRPCLQVSASYFIGGTIVGKDRTVRPGSSVRLKMETRNPDDLRYIETNLEGPFEFSPWFAKGVPYTVSVERQPSGEQCTIESPSGTTGEGNVVNRVRYVNEVLVKCVASQDRAEMAQTEPQPTLDALPRRTGAANLGNTLVGDAIAADQLRQRQREAYERLLRLGSRPSAELDAECVKRDQEIISVASDRDAAQRRISQYEGLCAKATQAKRIVAEQEVAEAAAERQRRQQAAYEAERSERESQELTAALGQLVGVLAQTGRQSPQSIAQNYVPQLAPRPTQAAHANSSASATAPDKYYSPLTCVSMGTQRLSDGHVIPCVQNSCGRTIEVHSSLGMWSVHAGVCYSGGSRSISLYGACEHNDGYERASGMCRR